MLGLALLEEMPARRVERDVISFSSAISAEVKPSPIMTIKAFAGRSIAAFAGEPWVRVLAP